MCGIAGELRFDGLPADMATLDRITRHMAQRGPDASGLWAQGSLGLGHRRLKVMDLTEASGQPMVDAEAGLSLVFNGAIYNYPQLRAELQAIGFQNVHVVARGVDTQLFNPARRNTALRESWGAGPDTLVMIAVGRLAPEKNLDVAVRAFEAMRSVRPDVKLVFVGDGPQRAALQHICSSALAGFKALSVMLAPILPALSQRVATELFGQTNSFVWADAGVLPSQINPFKHLMQRVEPAMFDDLFETPAQDEPPKQAAVPGGEPLAPTITIDDFVKIDLRVARIVNCEQVEGSTKLLRLTLDVGEGRLRNVFSGIKSAYTPDQLIGRLTVVVANLAPRKMKFGVSEGMVLAASHFDDKVDTGIYVLDPSSGAQPGMRIH